MRRVLPLLIVILAPMQIAQAGGPYYIAGPGYFNNGLAGTPLTWANGGINYYTDQGNLSPIYPGPSADVLVADAFSQWTSIPTAAVVANHDGQLAEDVNGSNVYIDSEGMIVMPADIMPSAVGTPVGVVYDYDGTVTDALLGQGAGDASECFGNAVYGGLDNFAASANFLHALVVINGVCLVTSTQQPDVEYRLVRVLGRVFGLNWSQVNLNVITGNPPPMLDDYTGFTIMHAVDPISCVPISLCYSDGGLVNPYLPKMDDQAALSSLYPVTPTNQSGFSGKQLFVANTAAIQGNVYFTDSNGAAAQPMQGINVVARWIDPNTGVPSDAYEASSLSGYVFTGNAGNMPTGYNDSSGNPFGEFGDNDTAAEGSFSLSGLQIPGGASTAQYQLSVEAIDPLWSELVGPYGPWQVAPSGSLQPIIVNVTLGSTTQQNILMAGSAIQTANLFGATTYSTPAPVPATGDWTAKISGYGDTDYLWFNAQNNRTLSVEVTALNEAGATSESKAQPVVGLWELSDPGSSPAPANTSSAFNSTFFGLTRLDATLSETTAFRLGIADYRGDGRPDYSYHARIFYGDTVSPARASVGGGTPLQILGLGFQPNTTLSIGASNAALLSKSSNQLAIAAPTMADGLQTLTLNDPDTGGSSAMIGALTYGAGPTDIIRSTSAGNPATPVGGQAPNPVIVKVFATDGVTPIAGASVFFTSSPPLSFSVCGGGASCTVLSDETGEASSLMTVLTSGVMTISAELAPASYHSPQTVQTSLLGIESALNLSLQSPYVSIAQGATVSVPLTARVLSNGIPQAGSTVDYIIDRGNATLSATTLVTDSTGYATSLLHIPDMSADVQVSVCVGPSNNPCQTFYGTAVAASAWQLQPISGSIQLVPVGQAFQPVTVRVVDNSMPPNPVLGAPIAFQTIVALSNSGTPVIWIGEAAITQQPLPVILSSSQQTLTADGNGLATIQPSSNGYQGAVVIFGTATAGAMNVEYELQSLWPPGGG